MTDADTKHGTYSQVAAHRILKTLAEMPDAVVTETRFATIPKGRFTAIGAGGIVQETQRVTLVIEFPQRIKHDEPPTLAEYREAMAKLGSLLDKDTTPHD